MNMPRLSYGNSKIENFGAVHYLGFEWTQRIKFQHNLPMCG